jgi:hypothetical protein
MGGNVAVAHDADVFRTKNRFVERERVFGLPVEQDIRAD